VPIALEMATEADELFQQHSEDWISSVTTNPRNLATETELREQAKVALRRFLEADIDQSGALSFEELKRLCDDMGLPMGEDEEEALHHLDKDGNGTIGIEEWVKWWLDRISTQPNPIKQQEAIAKNTFSKFDKDGSGYLNAEEFNALLFSLGADFTEEETREALDEIDTDDTGSIECSEFVAWWTNRASGNRGSSSLIALKLRKLAGIAHADQ
jgi:Ca2+-binding EF-hand superfamily protein